jgi:hypothetical protein
VHSAVGHHHPVSGDQPGDDDARLLRHAVRNNAEWCDVMCRAHGGSGRFQGGWWSSPRRTPPLHPDAVTLQPEVVEAQVLNDIDTTAGCSIKDSFSKLDLRAAGFHVLFDAEWVVRSPVPVAPAGGSPPQWSAIDDASTLAAWESAWSDGGQPAGRFPPGLLDHPSVVVLGGYDGARLCAGAILHRSDAVVGVTNLFTTTDDLAGAWAGCLAATADWSPALPIVGYEAGRSLACVRSLGFRSVGPLRIWTNDTATAE